MKLRAARSTDAGKLGAMISEAVADNSWKPKLHSGAEDIAHAGGLIARGWVTVCETGGEVAGFIARSGEEVHSLYVARRSQRAGVGAALLRDAMENAPRLSLWTFEANAGARRFYARHGFEESERTKGDNEEGLPDIRLVWQAQAKERSNG